MVSRQVGTRVLGVRILPNADPALREHLDVRPGDRSLGIFTTDCDDVSYAALDEATKKADVSVAYAKSMYAGAANASTALAGEFIGILSGPDPEEVRSGLDAAFAYIENDAHFYTANEDGSVVYFAHCISRTGSYLSAQAGLKAADVELKTYYGPPTETNFAGGLLCGSQAACRAACEAFAESVRRVAGTPLVY